MSEEIEGLGGPLGLAPGEKVPNQLRILAMQENLGNLRSVHRPATRIARLALKEARIYLFDKGVVVANGRGAMGLFRWEQVTVEQKGGAWLVTGPDKARIQFTKHWTDYELLGRTAQQAAARAAAQAEPPADGSGLPG